MSDLSQTGPEYVSNLIYHYTDQNGLLGIIRARSLWATHVHHLNDESEWKIGCALYVTCTEKLLEDEPEIRRRFPRMSDRFPGPALHDELVDFLNGIVKTISEQDAFIVCFSGSGPHDLETGRTTGDDLNQWRAYAGGTGGFAIGFDRDELVKSIRALAQEDPLSAIASHCVYNHSSLEDKFREITFQLLTVVENFKPMVAATTRRESEVDAPHSEERVRAVAALVQAIAQVKHEAFRSENEWRLTVLPRPGNKSLKFRSGKSSVIPFIELALTDQEKAVPSIREIVVGPSPRKEAAVAALKILLRENKYTLREDGSEEGVVIKASIIPYRNW